MKLLRKKNMKNVLINRKKEHTANHIGKFNICTVLTASAGSSCNIC